MIVIAVGLSISGTHIFLAEQKTIPEEELSSNHTTEKAIAQPAPESAPHSSTTASEAFELTFGSQAILDSCWSPKELEGSSEDKRIRKASVTGARLFPGRNLPKNPLTILPAERQNSIRGVKPADNHKLIALTFDLCESAGEVTGYDADVVNYLRRNRIKATFYASGKWMVSHPEKTMQLMADPLFEIGNHGWTHRNLRSLDKQKMAEEVLWPQVQYEILWEELAAKPCVKSVPPNEILKIQKVPLTFRFPFGTCNREALDFLAASGLPAIQWSVVTGDAAPGQPAGVISREILEKSRPGSIIICHANGRGHATASALPLFIPKLLQTGYKFVTVSELLASGSASVASECYEYKPGDNLRYDRISGAK